MANILFDNSMSASGNASLFVAVGDVTGWCALVVAAGQPVPAQPQSLSFGAVNELVGWMVFAPHAPTAITPADFVANVQQYATTYQPTSTAAQLALLWLAQPNTPPDASTLVFWLNGGNGSYSLIKQVSFAVGNDLLNLFLSTSNLTVDTNANRYSFSVPWQDQPSNNAQLTCNSILTNTPGHAYVLDYFYVPLTGAGAGHLLFKAAFDALLLPALGVGPTYYCGATPTPASALFAPLFGQDQDSTGNLILAHASLAPLALLDPASTYFAFTGKTLQTLQPAPTNIVDTVLPTALATDYGLPVSLLPVDSFVTDENQQPFPGPRASRLAFSNPTTAPGYQWQLVPSGYYTLALATPLVAGSGPARLLCGLAATESISFTPAPPTGTPGPAGDMLWFTPGAAYAPEVAAPARLQSAGKPTGNAIPSSDLLHSDYQTAWANVVPGAVGNAPVRYYAQPEGASLYAPGQGVSQANGGFMGYYATSASILSAALAFPLVPYGSPGISSSADILGTWQTLEQQVLSPTRKALIERSVQPVVATLARRTAALRGLATGQPATSPQGFYIEVDEGTGLWNKLSLASNAAPDQAPSVLQFVPPSLNLQSALQTNQLFLVVSADIDQGGDAGLGKFANSMQMEGWPFVFNLPKSNPNGIFSNVLLFKFKTGLALIDLVQNTNQWTMREQFNFADADGGNETLAGWLAAYLQSGIARYEQSQDQDYAKFARVVQDPNWQGVIGVNVDIGLGSFPAGLQGLLAGIDLTRFSAHHFGIDTSFVRVDPQSGTVQMQPKSAMFGLIDYEDRQFEQLNYSIPAYQAQAVINTTASYDFAVLSLKVLFLNSKISNYSSYLALTINRLFGEPVLSANNQNLLLFAGSYEDHNGTPVYAFNSIPVANGGANENYVLQVQSPVIGAVQVAKATFNTLVSQALPKQPTSALVNSVFSLWGFVDFKHLEGFDLLSYGNEVGETRANVGLSFAKLNIDVAFPLATPAAIAYTFDISQVAFDLKQSTARAASLVSHFPLQITGIVTGDKTNLPASQSFLSVALPKLRQQQAASGAWYGLQFSLNMGTLGALAGSVGFNAVFMMAWNVGGTGAAAGLKLPGVNPQAPFFSLQGVLRMNIGSLLLTLADDGVSYLMKINNIALKVLSLSFPPNGAVNFFLFGDPTPGARPQSLGWYAAYLKNSAQPARALPPAPAPTAQLLSPANEPA